MTRLHEFLPLAFRQQAYARRFVQNHDENLFMGSFASFEDAQAHAPPSKPVGYDNAEAAQSLYSHQLMDWDYPALYWLGDAFRSGMATVFDLGGHVGIKYYAFKRVQTFPDGLRWTVCDVPAVVQAGEALARERGVQDQLQFCADWRQASGVDVLYASGSLQYLPTDLAQILAALAVKPRRIVLNITAVHADHTLFTLNSIGVAVCPYRIQAHDALKQQLVSAGYRRRDGWRNLGKPIAVPFVAGGDQAYYCGACFDLRDISRE